MVSGFRYASVSAPATQPTGRSAFGGRLLSRWWGIALLVAIVVAVPLMHIVVAACGPATATSSATSASGHHSTPVAPETHSPHPATAPVIMPGTDQSGASMGPGDDCDAHTHGCAFLRGADVDPPPIIMVALIWGFLVLAGTVLRGFPVRTVLGRPPPWAMRSHLELQVIRC
ncbi:hypothetical protein Gbro_4416 [Gordonia bronchialis DSM 43247]|uniref:Uncharacterized protein n=2 Tax=Gordonia bronchialis TaxID=2054 RepID=D0L6J6_GORB4|nr:hypothetical protein Gbro_4416 [Gordonia bronchialis DSM 43247]STQ66558.1 Uncharacterised protein [Gordonia bronchialis]